MLDHLTVNVKRRILGVAPLVPKGVKPGFRLLCPFTRIVKHHDPFAVVNVAELDDRFHAVAQGTPLFGRFLVLVNNQTVVAQRSLINGTVNGQGINNVSVLFDIVEGKFVHVVDVGRVCLNLYDFGCGSHKEFGAVEGQTFLVLLCLRKMMGLVVHDEIVRCGKQGLVFGQSLIGCDNNKGRTFMYVLMDTFNVIVLRR